MARKGRMKSNYWCPVNLYGRPYKRRVLGKRIEGVASERDAVEEKSPAVEESSHGICVLFHGCSFLLPAAWHAVDAVKEAFLRHLRARGVEAGEMLTDHVRFVGRERGLGAF